MNTKSNVESWYDMPVDAIALGKRLRACRKDRGYTSEKLADVMDISPIHVRNIEGGARKPSLDALIQMCNILEISPDDLLYDSLGDYAKGRNVELAEKFALLTPGKQDVAMATIDALLALQKK